MRGTAASESWILKHWKRALAAAQQDEAIPSADWHSLRKTWATATVAAGFPLPLVQRWGGWSDLSAMQRYLGLQSPPDVAERLSSALRFAA